MEEIPTKLNRFHSKWVSILYREKRYFDFAFTQSDMDHDVNNRVISNVKESYSATLNSFYVGAGQSIHLNKRFKIIPEFHFFYQPTIKMLINAVACMQGDTKQIASYSTDSQMLSLGTIISTKIKSIGLTVVSMTPEFRLHWLRELNPRR